MDWAYFMVYWKVRLWIDCRRCLWFIRGGDIENALVFFMFLWKVGIWIDCRRCLHLIRGDDIENGLGIFYGLLKGGVMDRLQKMFTVHQRRRHWKCTEALLKFLIKTDDPLRARAPSTMSTHVSWDHLHRCLAFQNFKRPNGVWAPCASFFLCFHMVW